MPISTFFWSDIRLFLFDSFRHSFENNLLSSDQRRGILNLIPKHNKDLRYLKNWRPVTILNTDYKILTKALANRLQPLLTKIIAADQVGDIKGRQIIENIRIINDVMSYTDLRKKPGFITLIDFEKAFDSVEWPLLLKTLKALNFGNSFIHWITILYTKIQSCISNNGYFSEYFELGRGIRQGCPISALLFILVAEVMAIHIRNNGKIKSINVGNQIYKICQLADDTTLFLEDIESLGETILQLKKFQKCSGLKINLDKTEVIPVGIFKRKNIKLPRNLSQRIINLCPFKTLGIWVAYDINEVIKLNYQNRLDTMKSLISIWRGWNLSLKGKILIVKSLLLPQINYVMSNIYCPQHILQQIDKIIVKFIWNNNPPKVKRNAIVGNYASGGLKMPDIYSVNTVAKIKWIKMLLANPRNQGNWQCLQSPKYLLNIDKSLLKHKLPQKVKDKGLTPFNKQVLECWGEFHGDEPCTVEEICSEFIFNNKFICSNNKPLQVELLKLPNTRIFKDMSINDILENKGDILSPEQFCIKYDTFIDTLSYNRMTAAIPKLWKEILKLKINPVTIHKTTTIRTRGRLKDVTKVSNKALYWIAGGHGGRVVTLSSPTSEAGVRSP